MLYAGSLAASSLIEEEQQVWYFLAQTCLLLLAQRQWHWGLLALATGRLLRAWNQTGVKWLETRASSTGPIDFASFLNSQPQLLLGLNLVCLLAPLAALFRLRCAVWWRAGLSVLVLLVATYRLVTPLPLLAQLAYVVAPALLLAAPFATPQLGALCALPLLAALPLHQLLARWHNIGLGNAFFPPPSLRPALRCAGFPLWPY